MAYRKARAMESKSERLNAAIHWLHERQSLMTNELIDLCNQNSGSDNLPGLLAVARSLEELFSDLGCDMVRHQLPSRRILEEGGGWRESETGPGLQWSGAPCVGPRVLLAIHYDTVYGVQSPFQRCEMMGEDRLRGPGVIDAKGGIIVILWAIRAGLEFGLLKDVNWSIVLNPDEEIGSPSSSHLWQLLAGSFDRGMLFEPAMTDGSLVSTRKGSGNFTFFVRGKSAHAGRHFEQGRNAIVHASKLALELDSLNGQHAGLTMNLGNVSGGGPINVVPNRCLLQLNVRVTDQFQQRWVEDQLQRIQKHFDQESFGYRCELVGSFTSPPKMMNSATQTWMQEIESLGASLGESIGWKPSGGASDGNKLAALGLTTLDTFGPEGDCLHSPEEWVRLSSLPRKAALALSVLIRCSAS